MPCEVQPLVDHADLEVLLPGYRHQQPQPPVVDRGALPADDEPVDASRLRPGDVRAHDLRIVARIAAEPGVVGLGPLPGGRLEPLVVVGQQRHSAAARRPGLRGRAAEQPGHQGEYGQCPTGPSHVTAPSSSVAGPSAALFSVVGPAVASSSVAFSSAASSSAAAAGRPRAGLRDAARPARTSPTAITRAKAATTARSRRLSTCTSTTRSWDSRTSWPAVIPPARTSTR